MIGEDLRILHLTRRFEGAKTSVRRIEDERMADLVARDRVKIILFVTQIARFPPIIVASAQEPAERIEVAFDLNLHAARALERQLRCAAGLKAAQSQAGLPGDEGPRPAA